MADFYTYCGTENEGPEKSEQRRVHPRVPPLVGKMVCVL